jgi:hypothetical protein
MLDVPDQLTALLLEYTMFQSGAHQAIYDRLV